MKNFIQKLFLLFLLSCYGFINAQGQLTSGVQTSTLDTSFNPVSSTSDKNASFYASTYWIGGADCGNYLKIYDGTTLTATSPQVLVSRHHAFTRVRLDDDNNVYVLYTDRTSSGSSIYKTYLKKYNTSGTQVGSRIIVTSDTNATDIEVAPNGDVLIGCVEDGIVKIKIYRNMLFKGFLPVHSGIPTVTNSSPFAIQMDMKENKFVVGYSFGPSVTSASQLHIKRYSYVPFFMTLGPPINFSSLYSNYTESGTRFLHNNNQIALRSNWEVFYNIKIAVPPPVHNYRVKHLSSSGSSIFQHLKGFVDVDVNNRLLISKNYGSAASENSKVKLFDTGNTLIHEFTINDKIKNYLESIAIYDCEFIVTGIDNKFGANPLSRTRQSYHQVFNCKDCRPNMGATAVAEFRFPYQVNQYPSLYGPQNITELCLVDKLLVDGSLSSCENSYFVGLSEFNLGSWTDTLMLHSDWVTPLTQAPNDINIVDFLPPGYHLKPGKVYRFRLAVGNPWHSVDIFFEVSCCKRPIIGLPNEDDALYNYTLTFGEDDGENAEENVMNFKAYPNPVKDNLSLDFSNFDTKASKNISIKNIQGREFYSEKTTSENKTIDVKNWPVGIYIATAIIDGKTYQNKIIKK